MSDFGKGTTVTVRRWMLMEALKGGPATRKTPAKVAPKRVGPRAEPPWASTPKAQGKK